MSKLSEHINVRLKVYADLIEKPLDEALYHALGIAKAVYEKGIRLNELANAETDIITKSRYTIEMELRQDKMRQRNRKYYQSHKKQIQQRRKELKKMKEVA